MGCRLLGNRVLWAVRTGESCATVRRTMSGEPSSCGACAATNLSVRMPGTCFARYVNFVKDGHVSSAVPEMEAELSRMYMVSL